jgi:DNA-binding Xre family transcriptional regulator
MIKCNLAVLLAERNIKITKVSKDTGISRTTLTSLTNNYAQGIQFDTLDTLCKYLSITPDKLLLSSYVTVQLNSIEVECEDLFTALLVLKDDYREFESEITIDILQKREFNHLSALDFVIRFADNNSDTNYIKLTLSNLAPVFLVDINDSLCQLLIRRMESIDFKFETNIIDDKINKYHEDDFYNIDTNVRWIM